MVVVRIPKHDETVLSTALDAGAAGIVIPHCDNAAEIKHLLNEIYYRKYSMPCSGEKCWRNATDLFNSPNGSAIIFTLDFHTWNLRQVVVQR